jgi:hypothetical protein
MDNPETLATLDKQDTPVSLDCPFLIAPCFVYLCPVSFVSNVASVSGLSILGCPLFCLSLSCVLFVQTKNTTQKTKILSITECYT